MQYTASSFAQMIVGMFAWVLRPRTHLPHMHGIFPSAAEMHSHVDDVVLDRALIPAGRSAAEGFRWFHRFQQGLTQHYVLYVLLTVVVMLASLIPFETLLRRLFAL
jgi:hydrogenase-4 component B